MIVGCFFELMIYIGTDSMPQSIKLVLNAGYPFNDLDECFTYRECAFIRLHQYISRLINRMHLCTLN